VKIRITESEEMSNRRGYKNSLVKEGGRDSIAEPVSIGAVTQKRIVTATTAGGKKNQNDTETIQKQCISLCRTYVQGRIVNWDSGLMDYGRNVDI
jgi:hypothetical protein